MVYRTPLLIRTINCKISEPLHQLFDVVLIVDPLIGQRLWVERSIVKAALQALLWGSSSECPGAGV